MNMGRRLLLTFPNKVREAHSGGYTTRFLEMQFLPGASDLKCIIQGIEIRQGFGVRMAELCHDTELASYV